MNAGNIQEGDIKIIYESPIIPRSCLAIKSDLSDELKQTVTDFLLAYDNDEYFGSSTKRYVSIADADYDYVRDLQEKYDLED